MIRKLLLSALALVGVGLGAHAQTTKPVPCATDEHRRILVHRNPKILALEQQMEEQYQQGLAQLNMRRLAAKGASADSSDSIVYHIPVVIHIVHNYGSEYYSDNDVYAAFEEWKEYLLRQNSDTNQIVPQYRTYIPGTDIWYRGNPNVMLHLATKDPQGQPTRGITRTRSWLTAYGSDQSKLNGWNPTQYLNIWIVQTFDQTHAEAGAYALQPVSAATSPLTDGVIGRADQSFTDGVTIPHEIGHIFNLAHTWGNSNSPNVECGDDAVDDTPPTDGHEFECGAADLADSNCLRTLETIGKNPVDYNIKRLLPYIDSLNYLGVEFRTYTTVTINDVTIYPTQPVGSTYSITLRKNGFDIASVSGVTNTDSSAMTVPLNFSCPVDSGYQLILTDNPGCIRDSNWAPYSTLVSQIGGGGTLSPRFKLKNETFMGRYNYFYNMHISFTGVSDTLVGKAAPNLNVASTTNDSMIFRTLTRVVLNTVILYPYARLGSPFRLVLKNASGTNIATYNGTTNARMTSQAVTVNWVIKPGENYRMVMETNPGMLRDSDVFEDYNRGTRGALNLIADSSNNGLWYNYFYGMATTYGYFKFYSANDTSLIDYPDSTNTQNIMDYSSCASFGKGEMFTAGQADRMHLALNNDIAGRKNLWQPNNLALTGALNPLPDLAPIADFSVGASGTTPKTARVFSVAGPAGSFTIPFTFRNRSYNDTISTVSWNFGADAWTPTSTSTGSQTNGYTTPGWKSVELTANGTNSATGATWSNTLTADSVVYVADPAAVSGMGYFQDWNAGNDRDMFPMMNPYNSSYGWELQNQGVFDGTGVRFNNFDARTGVETEFNTPEGLFGDLYTRAFDLRDPAFETNCNLSFYGAGAWRTSNPGWMRDSLLVQYSVNRGSSWITMGRLGGTELGNNGLVNDGFVPSWAGDWKLHEFAVPNSVRDSAQVFFRFRFIPGISLDTVLAQTDDPTTAATEPDVWVPSSLYYFHPGNHFYMDRLTFSQWALGTSGVAAEKAGMYLAPNPTSGSATVTIQHGTGTAHIQVMDVSGKLVYQTSKVLNNTAAQVEIPASAIAVKGMYLVQVTTGNRTQTEKLVVY